MKTTMTTTMKVTTRALILMAAVSLIAVPIVAADSIDGAKLFSKKCKMCHAVDKKKSGPSIKAMSQDADQLRDVITNGGKKRMMKAYGKKFSADEIDALVSYLRSNQDDDKASKSEKKKQDKKKKHEKDCE